MFRTQCKKKSILKLDSEKWSYKNLMKTNYKSLSPTLEKNNYFHRRVPNSVYIYKQNQVCLLYGTNIIGLKKNPF